MADFGRLRYVEPTNFFYDKNCGLGNSSDVIAYPYENYAMSIDLSIKIANRYSCGFSDQTGEFKEIFFSSDKGTLSFVGGTAIGKDSNEGYLTTNYTDINMLAPDHYTSECLGIESINIAYNSWMYPQVTIKFVDVRGATVMQAAEYSYYNHSNKSDLGASTEIYKALFSFPYPMFTLKVKGFYGKGVTYKLAVQKTNMDFDAASGNFNITAEFVGYMFGIYSDMPLTYVAVAPFMDGGKEYWQNAIQEGRFRFRDINGNESGDMLTIPDLRKKLAEIAYNEEAISVATEGEQVQNSIDAQIDKINAIGSQFPFNTWYEGDKYLYKVETGETSVDTIVNTVSGFVDTLSGYCATYGAPNDNTHNVMDSLKLFCTKKADKSIIEIKFVTDASKADIKNGKTIDKYKPSKNNDQNKYNQYIEGKEEVIKYIDRARANCTNFSVFIISKSDGYTSFNTFIDSLSAITENLYSEKAKQDAEYKSKEASVIERVLGFRPSIKNIYDLVFAHMETFLHCFYASMNNIRTSLEGHSKTRQKINYRIEDGYTDTERQHPINKDGNIDYSTTYSNDRAGYLPPFCAYYKDDRSQDGKKQKVLMWPEELINGDQLEEVQFIKRLLNASSLYFDDAYSVEKYIGALSAKTIYNSSSISVANSTDIENFIPMSTYDFIYKDRMGNPYHRIKSIIKRDNSTDLIGNIMGIFALRAFYYMCTNDSDSRKEGRTFGILEAINFYKAVGDSFNESFINFIKTYADDKKNGTDRKDFIDTITTDAATSITAVWQFGGTNTNNSLFKKVGNNIVFNLYKGGDTDNRFLPMNFVSFDDIKGNYAKGNSLISNENYLTTNNYATEYSDSGISTFVIFEGRDYIKGIYNSIKNEADASEEYFKINKEGYGSRKKSEYGKIEHMSTTFRKYQNNIEQNFDDNTIKKGVIVKNDESIVGNGEIKKILTEKGEDEWQEYYIKYPSAIDEQQKNSLFNEPLYLKQSDIKSKAYLFLQSVPIKGQGTQGGIETDNENGLSLKLRLLREGSYYWRKREIDANGGVDPIIGMEDLMIKAPTKDETFCGYSDTSASLGSSYETLRLLKSYEYGHYIKWNEPKNTTPSRRKELIKLFENWAVSTDINKGFAANEPLLRDINLYGENGKNKPRDFSKGLDIEFLAGNDGNDSNNAIRARQLQKFLRNTFFPVFTTLDLYNGILGESEFSCNINCMKSAFNGFMEELHAIYGDEATDAKKNPRQLSAKAAEAEISDPFKNTDLKLSTYINLKSLYDKWLCSPVNGFDKTWVLDRKTDSVSDFDNFVYVDSFYHDIGYNLTVNVTKVSEWLSSCLPTSNIETTEGVLGYTGKTVYEFLTQVAQDCGGTLFSLPGKFGLNSEDNIVSMFVPHSINSDWNEDASSFIFMYTYKPSEHLGEPENHNIDMNGWSPEGDGFELSNEEIAGELFTDEGYTIPAFGVSYAKQNQAIFKNITLSTENAGTTEASLAATFNIASKASEGPRESSLYGQDLYRVYNQYSYGCTVECMGNMQIMPMMYFDLKNIPMWKGAYMIKKVSHNITAGNISTQFEGVRLNRYAIPMTDAVVITSKDTGQHNDDASANNNSSMANGGEFSMSTNGGWNSENDDIMADPLYQLPMGSTQDFNDNNVSAKKPIICITPGHGPNTGKKLEWNCMSKIIDQYLVPMLKQYKYKDGTPYNIQRCNKNGQNTSSNGYSMRETRSYIQRYGSDKVISIAMHWNGGGQAKHGTFLNKYSNGSRADSQRLAQYMQESFQRIAQNGIDGKYITMPYGMTKGGAKIEHLGETNTDGGPQQACACVLTENFFADYPSGCKWDRDGYNITDETGRYISGRGWLESPEGAKAIAEGTAIGIKNYIDSLWN